MQYRFSDLAYAYGKPETKGRLKVRNSDFQVDEIMPVQATGEGEHLWLKIEKDGSNTDWVAQQLAKLAGVKSMAVSYAGMKDRHAITTQWFSVHLPGIEDPDFSVLSIDDFKILQQTRHNRKLKRGALSGNQFRIRVTELEGKTESLDEKLQLIKQNGVPNYFGEQRFGREMGNLAKAVKMFNQEIKKLKKQQRGLYLSSARSWIFNQILSTRIRQNNWLVPMQGEVFMLNRKSACFTDESQNLQISEEIKQRLLDKEINLTGCLWGEGKSMAMRDVLELERQLAEEHKQLAEGIESARLKQERRALRLVPENLNWEITGNTLNIEFDLPAGAFATMVLRECIDVLN